MQGLHLTADLFDCQCAPHWLIDANRLLAHCAQAARDAGLTPVAQLGHPFPMRQAQPGGVTAAVLLAESHLCVHTWPERGAVTLDVYVCNVSADHTAAARALLQSLLTLFQAAQVQQAELQRGQLPPPPP